jgi:hypothetical protein
MKEAKRGLLINFFNFHIVQSVFLFGLIGGDHVFDLVQGIAGRDMLVKCEYNMANVRFIKF